jgi:hypothetical protein
LRLSWNYLRSPIRSSALTHVVLISTNEMRQINALIASNMSWRATRKTLDKANLCFVKFGGSCVNLFLHWDIYLLLTQNIRDRLGLRQRRKTLLALLKGMVKLLGGCNGDGPGHRYITRLNIECVHRRQLIQIAVITFQITRSSPFSLASHISTFLC